MAKVTLLILLTLLLGCGGGGSSRSDIVIDDLLGKWIGGVYLTANYCPRQIPDEFQTISFVHNVLTTHESAETVTVLLLDGDRTCVAEKVNKDGNTFQAVCEELALPGFIEGYDCREELIWDYIVYDSTGTAGINPVNRRSIIRCFQGEQLSFVCSVDYEGSAGRCIRDLC